MADGSTIELGARQWVARFVDADNPELTSCEISNNGRQCVVQRMHSVAHELKHRSAEVEALKARQSSLTAVMEEVSLLCCSLHTS